MLAINCNGDQRGVGRRSLGPQHPLSNYLLVTVSHRHDPTGSLTHALFCSPPYLAPHTRYVGQQIKGRSKGGGAMAPPTRHRLISCRPRMVPHSNDPPGRPICWFSHFPLSTPTTSNINNIIMTTAAVGLEDNGGIAREAYLNALVGKGWSIDSLSYNFPLSSSI